VGEILDILNESQFSEELRQQAKRLTVYCNRFRGASNRSAIFQLVTTAIPFFVTMGLMFWAVQHSVLITLLLSVPAGALLIRFFALQHDCGHGSLFPSRRVNENVGRLISILTFTPYDHWRRSHALHHQTSGNLEKRGFGDIETMTVREYRAKTFWGRLRYRLYRHPIVVLVIGPPLFFLVLQRLAMGSNMPMRDSLLGILGHDLVLLLVYGTLTYFAGWQTTLTVLLPIYLIATWIGGWLFFVQHQFEETHWEGADEWDMKIAALKGSSFLVMPTFMNWITCNIGIHHIHHLCSKIPNYRLRECLNGNAELQKVSPHLSLWEGIACARLALWDEANRRLISFREYARLRTVKAD
jgi:acyl-lipid omega-6 desaturase (Delta-12 desaturase)